jgi:hypothetical protein
MPNLTLDMSELEFMQEHYSFGPQIVDSVAVEATKALLQGGRCGTPIRTRSR